jgi:hypothetical protein
MGKHRYTDHEIRAGWITFRRQVALALMFFGVCCPLAWLLDQAFESQRPTDPVAAFTLGPALFVAGYLLDRGAIRHLLSGGRTPAEPPSP